MAKQDVVRAPLGQREQCVVAVHHRKPENNTKSTAVSGADDGYAL